MDFALKFVGKDQKNKKGFHRKTLILIPFTRSVLLIHRKKAFVVICFKAKVWLSSCASIKVYFRLGNTSSDLERGARPKMPPTPCIGVTRIFDGGANQKSHVVTSSEIFERGTFCGTKMS